YPLVWLPFICNFQAGGQRLYHDETTFEPCLTLSIHKSKGLEYPLVWLPFICNFQAGGQRLYHDETTFEPCLTLS
ncbi:hypothetical protein, partial [Escherichia coli]|uniref:hypothetical protein n=1 Tax=Escherichia coli TaxID=562 RepID=UPI000BD76270